MKCVVVIINENQFKQIKIKQIKNHTKNHKKEEKMKYIEHNATIVYVETISLYYMYFLDTVRDQYWINSSIIYIGTGIFYC